MRHNCLAIRQNENMEYPSDIPFDQDECFTELRDAQLCDGKNDIYRNIRQSFIDLAMDSDHIGTPEWSPMSEIVSPGNNVVIKPNLVLHSGSDEMQEYITTHASVVRPIIDYCWKAMDGLGLIVVGDACSAEADFNLLVYRTGLKGMIEVLRERGVNVELHDFRALKVITENGIWVGEQKISSATPSTQVVNLGNESQFAVEKYNNVTLHGAGYDIKTTMQHHNGSTQEYCVSKTLLNADVVISVPKFKTHRAAGITCCMKNLVGINVDKNFLPHFTMGSANMGGDEMPVIEEKYIFRLKAYNWVRMNIIGYMWKLLGKPGVKVLRLLKGRELKDETVAVETQGAAEQALKGDKEINLAKWFHGKLSGQSIAAGAWAGNETICRMIIDLNRIFLCCDKNGVLRDKTDRKIFYVIDGVSMGMGNGPITPIPVKTGLVAAGWNGYMIDTSIIKLFGVDPDSITLYNMAKNNPWIFLNAEGNSLFNGEILDESTKLPIELIPPDGWVFVKRQ